MKNKSEDKTEPLVTPEAVAQAEDSAALMDQAAVPTEPLVTALDVAQAKSQFDPCPLTASFYAALRGTPAQRRQLPTETLRDGKAIAATSQTVSAIVWDSGETLCSPDELEKLRDIQAKMTATIAVAARYSLSGTSDELNTKRDQMQTAMLAGEDVSGVTLESRETVQHNRRTKQAALLAMLEKTTREEVVPLARPILERFEKLVENFMRCQEETDRGMCAGFGLDYHPGLLWKAGAAVAQKYETGRRLNPIGWHTPKSILEGVIEL
jgi:hypothetical protein